MQIVKSTFYTESKMDHRNLGKKQKTIQVNETSDLLNGRTLPEILNNDTRSIAEKPTIAMPNGNSPTGAKKICETNNVINCELNSYASNLNIVKLSSYSESVDEYRLRLYNYAFHMDRLRNSTHHLQYTTAAAVAAAVAYRSNTCNKPDVSKIPFYSMPSYLSSNRISVPVSFLSNRVFQPEEPKPQHSYIGLIAMAILSSSELKLVLSDIYQYILDNYPYFRTRGPGWRNSIRHNLSLNDCFIKSGRSANGKGHYWAIHPANMEDFRKGDFRRRKAQRKVRRHMGLSVEDNGADSPSPPPLNLSPPILPSHEILTCHTPHNRAFSVTEQFTAFGYLHNNLDGRNTYSAMPAKLNGYSFDVTTDGCEKYPRTLAETGTNIYCQSRKRQFDVASLLAPDVSKEEDKQPSLPIPYHSRNGFKLENLQNPVRNKFHCNDYANKCSFAQQSPASEEQNDDIDVVDNGSEQDTSCEGKYFDNYLNTDNNIG